MTRNKNQTKQDKDKKGPAPPSISLPKGGGAIKGIDEKFSVNPSTGTASLSVPIFITPGRSGFHPKLSLSYDSGAGNGPFGLGWSLPVPSITRKTDKGIPEYRDAEESDTFILSGAEDLVPTLLEREDGTWERDAFDRTLNEVQYSIQRYRPRTEGLFARIERWTNKSTGEVHWESTTKDNVKSIYGKSSDSKVADPEDPPRVFKWLLEQTYDDKGNVIVYEYKQENRDGVDPSLPQEKTRLANGNSYSNLYLKRIKYGNETPYYPQEDPSLPENWFFEVVFDYGEHDRENPAPGDDSENRWNIRDDSFSSFKSGFEIRTQRLCKRVLMFHHFTELGDTPCLVRSTNFKYEENPVLTKLESAIQTGYVRNLSGDYTSKSLPPVEFDYIEPEIDETIKHVDGESLEDLPSGLNGNRYQWVDLNGEGVSGVLKEEGNSWFYKSNLGEASFSPFRIVATTPSVSNLQASQQRVMDLAGDGKQDLVLLSGSAEGYFERGGESGWQDFIPFRSSPKVTWNNPNLRLVDLNGDGHADIFVTENDEFVWHPSLAKEGFGPAEIIRKSIDEEEGPTLVFADATQSVHLADITGDGLSDLVRIRNGEICYWPNKGYGRFGAKVTMGSSPYFDHPDYFDQDRIRLADIDGSGTTDIIYLGREEVTLWFNQAGNSWSEPRRITRFPKVDNLSSVTVMDLLGEGTACLVWSSNLPGDSSRPMRYIDLMSGEKPHLLKSIKNNMGAETRIRYAPSTKFYLKDKREGNPWITKLPFPVQVVERIDVREKITGTKLVTRYAYHHGYFDGNEREFRGFGMVEKWDTESFSNETDEPFHVPPVYTKTWFHTGAYFGAKRISRQYEDDYYEGDELSTLLPDTIMPNELSADEEREAARALKGKMLRREVYALDDTPESSDPYTVTESNYKIKSLQPKLGQKHAVFFTHAYENLTYHYERNPEDPRVSHKMVLNVDDFGNVEKSATIVCPRRSAVREEVEESNGVDLSEQNKTLITYTETDFINKPDERNFYRVGVPFETRTYELTGISGSAEESLSLTDLRDALEVAGEIRYEESSTSGKEKRLIERERILYYKDDLSGALPLGEIESLALPFEKYKMAFTPGLLTSVYGSRVDDDMLREEGGYIKAQDYKSRDLFPEEDRDGVWWTPSGRQEFDESHFYLPIRYIDPFDQEYTITYDRPYFLLKTRSEGPLGNRVESDNDYRTMKPRLVTDPNDNRSEVAFDALGMVVGTAVMGKKEENKGDSLTDFDPDLDDETIKEHIDHPLADPHSILGKATTRMVYDVGRYYREGKPNVVYTLSRETHESDLESDENTRIQHNFLYSDGLGRGAQTKIQAEPGPLNGVDAEERWIGTGYKVFNNKGKPIKGYEPFFDEDHAFNPRKVGVSRTLLYDPLERVVATLHPNHTYEKVAFDPWRQAAWDTNDTATQEDPKDDPDVGGFFTGLDSDDYLQTWYTERIAGDLGAAERSAAEKTAAHANTPALQYMDVLGRQILEVAHNIKEGTDEFIQTRTELDIEGNVLSVTDDRDNIVMTYKYALQGSQVYQNSMDAGERWALTNVTGNLVHVWDSRGHHIRTRYDALQRPTHIFVTDEAGDEILAERLVYGEEHTEARERNLKGQLHLHFDGAGVVKNHRLDFKGNLLQTSRQVAIEYRDVPDWSIIEESNIDTIEDDALSLLEREDIFTNATAYDALNRPIKVISPDNSTYYPIYNEANLLEQVKVNLKGAVTLSDERRETIIGSTELTEFVKNIDYDAKGQRELIEYGNSVTTDYDYDEKTFRLIHLHSTRSSGTNDLQNLHYTYDPVGNITQIRDDAIEPVYFNNEAVEAASNYTYDPLYRLIKATGRESAATSGQPTQEDISWNDQIPAHDHALRNYTQFYDYDTVGNILQMRHSASGGGWTRRYEYEDTNNRLKSTSRPGDSADPPYSDIYTYDDHGNMTSMSHLSEMIWDHKDQLKEVNLEGGGRAYYTYDAGRQRVRKVIQRSGAVREERIYLGGFEIYRKFRNDDLEKEMETLHIMDDQKRIAMVETTTVEDRSDITDPDHKFRYQLSNHLGSATMELDESGKVITYEEYHPYGTTAYRAKNGRIEVSEKRYRYTGKERDEETGLNYHRARYYLPWVGRWGSTDPVDLEDGINFYRYVDNAPFHYVDDSGTNGDDPTLLERIRRSGRAGRLAIRILKEFSDIGSDDPNTRLGGSGGTKQEAANEQAKSESERLQGGRRLEDRLGSSPEDPPEQEDQQIDDDDSPEASTPESADTATADSPQAQPAEEKEGSNETEDKQRAKGSGRTERRESSELDPSSLVQYQRDLQQLGERIEEFKNELKLERRLDLERIAQDQFTRLHVQTGGGPISFLEGGAIVDADTGEVLFDPTTLSEAELNEFIMSPWSTAAEINQTRSKSSRSRSSGVRARPRIRIRFPAPRMPAY